MHEVEPFGRADPREQVAAGRGTYRIPARVRQDRSPEPVDHARPHAAPRGPLAMLMPFSEHNLHPYADPEHRTGSGQPLRDDLITTPRPKALNCASTM